MENNNKRYWKGIEELTNDIDFVKKAEKEFPDYLPVKEHRGETESFLEGGRRDFLKLLGFSVAAVSVAACDAPVKKAIPYLNKPVDVDPTIPNYYASTYFKDGEYASILVKTREGRPIKIEGNNLSKITNGVGSARVQASVLDLYDISRYQGFAKKDGKVPEKKEDILAQNEAIDKEIKQKLASSRNIRIVSPTIISPSTKAAIQEFKNKYPSTEHVMYDASSAGGMLKANQASFGQAVLPTYDFSKAKVIVSFGADFLGTWLSPTEFAYQYAQNRKLGKDSKEMSRHFQFESNLSVTGANADYRVRIKPSQEGLVVASLYKKLTGSDKFKDARIDKMLDKVAKELKAANGKALVVSGSDDHNVQTVVNAINNRLNSYGNTISLETPSYTHQGMPEQMDGFIEDVKSNKVDAVIFYGVNPVYSHARGEELQSALKNVALKISLAQTPDETTALCDYVCPDNHYLESWNDAEPRRGHFSLTQPAITNIYQTRQAQQSLLTWADNKQDFYDYIRNYWNQNLLGISGFNSSEDFWNRALHDGIFQATSAPVQVQTEEGDEETQEAEGGTTIGGFSGDVNGAIADINKDYKADSKDLELSLYQKVAIGTGTQANNPWLQEMPDPISKACWGNYLCISQKTANELDLSQEDVVKVEAKGFSFEAPVLIQPGQAEGSVAIALGYGRKVSGKVGQEVGVNVAPLSNQSYVSGIKITKTGERDRIAQTQTHHTIMGRNIIQESTLKQYQKDPAAGREYTYIHTPEGLKRPTEITLWKGHTYPNHSWGMNIDLNSCIGCGACTIACQSENNIPVVGKKEVLMRREMHWIRIDRYYSSDAEEGDLSGMEDAAENPEVTFMPMMCQHCNNAPCETVCPVLATTHSTEGLNQMTYNRCIGTRYCANNCPYKVRRFNWFHYAEDKRFTDINYQQTSDLGKMVLNPDVTVRSRGVMEKCTMCIQRIQAGKLEAKKEKREVRDGEIKTACQQVCPTQAITFGDMNDASSQLTQALGITDKVEEQVAEKKHNTEKVINEPRAYHVLDEINVKPQITYLTKIRNKDEAKESKGGHSAGGHSS